MTKIVQNEIKRIVSFGCSFTAGDELLDHLLPEDIYNLRLKCKSYPEWYHLISKDKIAYQKFQIIREKAKNHTYGKFLADLLNKDYLNLALSGNSNQHIIYQIEQFYQSGFRPGDYILIGLTYPTRVLEFKPELNETRYHLLQYLDNKEVVKWHNNDRIIFDHLRDLQCLGFYKHQCFNNLLSIVKIWSTKSIFKDLFVDEFVDNDNRKTFQKTFFDLHNSDLFIQNSFAFTNIENPRRLHFGHMPEDLHLEFAQDLHKYFTGAQ